MKKAEKDFIKGIALGLSVVADAWGEYDMAQMALKETGYTRDDLVSAGVEPIDIENIFNETSKRK